MQEKELFRGYELTGLQLSPRIYKILGAAVAVHLLGFFVVAQMNLFGTRACDSPYVGKVCQVIETAYIASTLLGTDTEFSSRDYEKTEIEEPDFDVTFVNVDEQLTYPAGYFELANPTPPPTDLALMNGENSFIPNNPIPGIPSDFSSPSTLDPTKPAVLPTPNPDAIQGGLPTSALGNIKTPPPVKYKFPKVPKSRPFPPVVKGKNPIANDSPSVLPSDEELAKNTEKPKNDKADRTKKPESKKTPESTETANSDNNGLFNKKPLEDFGTEYGTQILSKEVDINAPFEIEVRAKLDEKGKFIKPTMTSKPGSDPKMTEVAKKAIAAFGDSQLLKSLYDVGGRSIVIKFAQDNDNLKAIILTETESDKKAEVLHSLLNISLKYIDLKEGSDEQILMKKAQFLTQGKNFIINFLIPNDEKTQMIEKNLRSLQEKQKKSDNGDTQTTGKVVSAGK